MGGQVKEGQAVEMEGRAVESHVPVCLFLRSQGKGVKGSCDV